MSRISKNKAIRILKYLRPYIGVQIEIILCMLIMLLLSLVDPLIIKVIIDSVLVNGNAGLLNILAIGLILLFIFRAIFRFMVNYLYTFVGQRVLFDVRHQLFQHLESLSLSFFSRTKTGEILSRVNNDVNSLQSIVTNTVIRTITDSLTVLGIIGILFYLEWRLTLLMLIVFPMFIIILIYFSRRIRKKSKLIREKAADILSFFQEAFSGVKLIQSFVKEKYEAMRHLRLSKDMINRRLELSILGTLSATSSGFFASIGSAIVLWYGGYRVIEGAFTIGGLFAFYAYVGRLFRPVNSLVQLNVTMQTALASIDRIFEFLDIAPEIKDKKGAKSMDNLSGDIRFKNVYFSYNGKEEVLKGVDFQIDQGQTVALVGPSGAGKTTIANLLCRFYEPQRGSITIDGVNIYDIKLKSLRKNIAVVTQETFLFNASILDNIKYSHRKASLEEVIYAAHLANLHEFIQSLPHGYDTVIGDRGVKLSGGQKQRIAIARAILRNPSILILDEATSSLDSESERLIQEALENFMKGRTTLVIAHRLSTVVNADKIIVLDQGRVLGQGGHEELYLSNSLYRKLCDEQFGESNKVLRKESLAV